MSLSTIVPNRKMMLTKLIAQIRGRSDTVKGCCSIHPNSSPGDCFESVDIPGLLYYIAHNNYLWWKEFVRALFPDDRVQYILRIVVNNGVLKFGYNPIIGEDKGHVLYKYTASDGFGARLFHELLDGVWAENITCARVITNALRFSQNRLHSERIRDNITNEKFFLIGQYDPPAPDETIFNRNELINIINNLGEDEVTNWRRVFRMGGVDNRYIEECDRTNGRENNMVNICEIAHIAVGKFGCSKEYVLRGIKNLQSYKYTL